MAEYIDRVEYCEKHCRCSNEYCDRQSCPIWKAPAADVAPVVYCRECKRSGLTEFGKRYCSEPMGAFEGCIPVEDDSFCSGGKRREDPMPKTNPRRIPRTQADVDKAYSNGIVEGLSRGIDLMLYVLIDKHDAPMDDVQQLAGELNHAAQCVAEGYVTWADIRQMLKEYGVETALE